MSENSNKIKSYRDLIIWKKSVDFATVIYRITNSFPKTEQFNLTSQLRRAAVSISSNIAEGHGRTSTAEFLRFLTYSNGSRTELETQIIIAYNLKYINKNEKEKILESSEEIGRLMSGLVKSLRKKGNREKRD